MTILLLVTCIFNVYSLVPFARDTFNLHFCRRCCHCQNGHPRTTNTGGPSTAHAVLTLPVEHDTIEYRAIFSRHISWRGVKALVLPNTIRDGIYCHFSIQSLALSVSYRDCSRYYRPWCPSCYLIIQGKFENTLKTIKKPNNRHFRDVTSVDVKAQKQ